MADTLSLNNKYKSKAQKLPCLFSENNQRFVTFYMKFDGESKLKNLFQTELILMGMNICT